MGMEQRGLADDGDIHKHCMTCIKVLKCSTRPQKDRGCSIVSCEFDCGSRFHTCKLKEHLVLCSNVKVPCINYVSGCPVWLLRGHMGKHLRHCPASVVHCMIEWNRWPSQADSPPPCGTSAQLDVALALRDQRALNLAQLPSQNGNETACQTSKNGHDRDASEDGFITMDMFSYDTCDTPWETKKVPPGLQRSVCSELYRASRHATESLAAAITVITGHATSRNGCYTVNGAGSSDIPRVLNGRSCYDPVPSSGTICPSGGGPKGAIHLNGVKALDSKSLYSIDLKTSGSDCGGNGTATTYSPLKLDLSLESIAWYQPKPKSMYTFPCGQVFRRDEYAWHYQNVHSEIHGGLNGWLEQRCPLAQYGCTFSRRRLYPSPPGSVLVHNDIIESFGLQIPSPTSSDLRITNGCGSTEKATHQQIGINQDIAKVPDTKSASFNNLPFEVLQHIARFLDSFSLCNFALVSRAMRDICRSLLEERGMVILHWEKQNDGWKVSHKRWHFSTAFSPIQEWCFSDDSNMSNHLSRCPYFLRNVKVEPFFGLGADARPFEVILREEIRMPHHISLEAMMLSPIGKQDYERQMTKL